MKTLLHLLRLLVGGALLWSACTAATAQASFPDNRPVTLVVPYAAGGFTDQLARAIAPALAERWGQPVLVDNRTGGGTTIGTAAVARAAGDGHTLLLTGFGYTINPLVMKRLPYDPQALVPLTLVAEAPSVLYVANKVPARTLPELVAWMRSRPGQVAFASSGNGSSPHVGAELFAALLGTTIVHAPYRGNAPALQDLVGGQVDAMFDSPNSMSYVRAGRLKVLGIASAEPSPQAPELVPLARAGVPELAGFTNGGWFGFFLPASTPAALQQRLHDDLQAVLAQPAVRAGIEKAGGEPRQTSQAAFADYLAAETRRWGPIVRERQIQVD